MTDEEKMQNFRRAFNALPKSLRLREAKRAYKIATGTDFYILEDTDIGKDVTFATVRDLIEYLYKYKQISTSSSYIFRVLKTGEGAVKGYKIYRDKKDLA